MSATGHGRGDNARGVCRRKVGLRGTELRSLERYKCSNMQKKSWFTWNGIEIAGEVQVFEYDLQ